MPSAEPYRSGSRGRLPGEDVLQMPPAHLNHAEVLKHNAIVQPHYLQILDVWRSWTCEEPGDRLESLLTYVARYFGPLPASQGHHHSIPFGALAHTFQVMALLMESASGRASIRNPADGRVVTDRADIALVVALVAAGHDMGKPTDFEYLRSLDSRCPDWVPEQETLADWAERYNVRSFVYRWRPMRGRQHELRMEEWIARVDGRLGWRLSTRAVEMLRDILRTKDHPIWDLLSRADIRSSSAMRLERKGGQESSPVAHPVIAGILKAIQRHLDRGDWYFPVDGVPRGNSRLLPTDRGVLLIVPRAAEEIATYLRKELKFPSADANFVIKDLAQAGLLHRFTSNHDEFDPSDYEIQALRGPNSKEPLRAVRLTDVHDLQLPEVERPVELHTVSDACGEVVEVPVDQIRLGPPKSGEQMGLQFGSERPNPESPSAPSASIPPFTEQRPASEDGAFDAASLEMPEPSAMESAQIISTTDDLSDPMLRDFVEQLILRYVDIPQFFEHHKGRTLLFVPETFEQLGIGDTSIWVQKLEAEGLLQLGPQGSPFHQAGGKQVIALSVGLSALVDKEIVQKAVSAPEAVAPSAPPATKPCDTSPSETQECNDEPVEPGSNSYQKKKGKSGRKRRRKPRKRGRADTAHQETSRNPGIPNWNCDTKVQHVIQFLLREHRKGRLKMGTEINWSADGLVVITSVALERYKGQRNAKFLSVSKCRDRLVRSNVATPDPNGSDLLLNDELSAAFRKEGEEHES